MLAARLEASLLARSDWNQEMLSARAERTEAREANKAASVSGELVFVVVVVDVGCGVVVEAWEVIVVGGV